MRACVCVVYVCMCVWLAPHVHVVIAMLKPLTAACRPDSTWTQRTYFDENWLHVRLSSHLSFTSHLTPLQAGSALCDTPDTISGAHWVNCLWPLRLRALVTNLQFCLPSTGTVFWRLMFWVHPRKLHAATAMIRK